MKLFALIAPDTARNILLAIVGGCYLVYRLYHAWRWWRGKARVAVGDKVEEKVKVEGQGQERKLPTAVLHSKDHEGEVVAENAAHERPRAMPTVQHNEEKAIHCSPAPATFTSTALTGEELYAQARTIPHQPIPDCERDGEYLKLLVKSAELGYPRAMAKLGDYAMRRGWTVEAYYWLWRAKKGGMENLERMLLQVRSTWANEGFRRESANEYECFTHEQGTIGYALLCIDSRRKADAAKSRLAELAPEFIS